MLSLANIPEKSAAAIRQSSPSGKNTGASILPNAARMDSELSFEAKSLKSGETLIASHTASDTVNTTVDNFIINSLKFFSKDFERVESFGILKSAISSISGSGLPFAAVFERMRE